MVDGEGSVMVAEIVLVDVGSLQVLHSTGHVVCK